MIERREKDEQTNMYSTKKYCDKQEAFTRTGFLCVGDPFVQRQIDVPARFKGKQLLTHPGKKGRNLGGVGTRPYPYKADPFDDSRATAGNKPSQNPELAFEIGRAHV